MVIQKGILIVDDEDDEDYETLLLELCLCDRDPDDPDVRDETQRALALSIHYQIELTGCLYKLAEAFDRLVKKDLNKRAAGDLLKTYRLVKASEGEGNLPERTDATKLPKLWLN